MAVDCMSRRMLESRKDAQELVCNSGQLFVYNFEKESGREACVRQSDCVFPDRHLLYGEQPAACSFMSSD